MYRAGQISIRRYQSDDASEWNAFLTRSKNATFLFHRDYLSYHAQRFQDHSLVIEREGEIAALFVANEKEDRIESHGGLTYGGLILHQDARLVDVLQYFYHLLKYYSNGFRLVTYKCLPAYFATRASNEDQYAMHVLQAKLLRRDTSSVFDRDRPTRSEHGRLVSQRRGESGEWKMIETPDPTQFWDTVLIPNLRDRYDASPVHTSEEMKMLMDYFPHEVHVFELHHRELLAGAVVYQMPTVAHVQYISSSANGRHLRATDILILELMNRFSKLPYFSLGTSNGEEGHRLNVGLVNWKEGFGARTWTHDIYEVSTDAYTLLSDYA